MARFCANCGTEVDESASFCPTCGQPLDEASETQMPAAPAWPEAPSPAPYQPAGDERNEAAADATGVEERAEPPAEPYRASDQSAYRPSDQPAAYQPPQESAAEHPPPGAPPPPPATQYPPP